MYTASTGFSDKQKNPDYLQKKVVFGQRLIDNYLSTVYGHFWEEDFWKYLL